MYSLFRRLFIVIVLVVFSVGVMVGALIIVVVVLLICYFVDYAVLNVLFFAVSLLFFKGSQEFEIQFRQSFVFY